MSITKKLYLLFSGLTVGIVLVFIILNLFFAEPYFIGENRKQMLQAGEGVRKKYPDFGGSSFEDFEEEMNDLSERKNMLVRVINKYNQVLFISGSRQDRRSRKLYGSILNDIADCRTLLQEEDHPYVLRNLEGTLDKNDRLLYIAPMGASYYVLITKSISGIQDNVQIANRFIFFTGLIFLAFGLLAIALFSRTITRPIIRISHTADRIANMDFSERAEVSSKDELGVLADSINQIADTLGSNIESLQTEVEKRKQLIRDMSHELKTPIAAVKGYAEGLQYGLADKPEKRDKYCHVIVQECGRMDELVKKMLRLSRIEEDKSQEEWEALTASQLVRTVEERYHLSAQEKNLQFSVCCADGGVMRGDVLLLQQAVCNFMDNALRYTQEKGEIRLRCTWDASRCFFRVYNTGQWISAKDQEKIWDAFYKTDPARTRENEEHSGIGLSLVEVVARQHGGGVSFANCDGGVEFGFWVWRQAG